MYIAHDNADASRRFLDAGEATYRKLAAMPRMGVAQRLNNPTLSGLRCIRIPGFRNYLIFYLPRDDGIEVVRVLHGARDYPRLFG